MRTYKKYAGQQTRTPLEQARRQGEHMYILNYTLTSYYTGYVRADNEDEAKEKARNNEGIDYEHDNDDGLDSMNITGIELEDDD